MRSIQYYVDRNKLEFRWQIYELKDYVSQTPIFLETITTIRLQLFPLNRES